MPLRSWLILRIAFIVLLLYIKRRKWFGKFSKRKNRNNEDREPE